MGLPILKLKTDVPRRWNSTLHMIQRIVATKIPVIAPLALIGDRLCSPAEYDGDVMPMTNHEWLIAEQSVEVLEIFDITNVISAEKKVTASTVILFHKKITYSTQRTPGFGT